MFIRSYGYTLIELLLTIALVAGLLVVGLVTFTRWVDKNQLIKTTDVLIDTLEFARNSAMVSNAVIEVCPRDVGEKCGEDWDAGQLVRNSQDHTLLRVEEAVPEGYFILWRPALNDLPFIQFKPDGFLASGLQGSFYICAKRKYADSSKIVLLRTGRVRALTGDFPECHS